MGVQYVDTVKHCSVMYLLYKLSCTESHDVKTYIFTSCLPFFAAKCQKPKEVRRMIGQQPASRLPLALRCSQRSTPRTRLRTCMGIKVTGDLRNIKNDKKIDGSLRPAGELDEGKTE